MTCFLFHLPLAISCDILTLWVSNKDVTRLDSSCTSQAIRGSFLRCISSKELVLQELQCVTNFLPYVRWLNLRSTSVAGLSVPTLHLNTDQDDFISAKNVARLKTLNLETCGDLSDSTFRSIVKDCKFLVDIKIGSEHHLTWITDISLQHLSKATSALRTFGLHHNAFVTDEGLATLFSVNCLLRDVRLVKCGGLGDRSLLAIAKYCSTLEAIKLSGIPFISSAALATVFIKCRALRKIEIVNCAAALPPLNCSANAGVLARLEELTVADIPHGGKLHLTAFLSRTINLRILDLREVRGLSDDDFLNLSRDLTKLEKLRVFSCPGLTAVGIAALIQRCPSLQEVCLHASDVTVQVTDTMARHCRQLTSLSLTWSASVTDAALIALIAPLPVVPLTCVRLNGCAQVTSSSVQLLVDALPNLASLEVSYCPKITIAAMAEVAARCRNIQFGRTGSY